MSASLRNKRKIRVGFSPCPNDTFMFDALVNGQIQHEQFEFDFIIADVEELNRKAFHGELDMTKLSVHAFGHVADRYSILNSGAALGHNCGPLLIGKNKIDLQDISSQICAIPGKYTTAFLLSRIFFPDLISTKEILFSEIEDAVLHESASLGLIIHESRFTFQDKGLIELADLGKYWYRDTGLPLPLGVIAIHKHLETDEQKKLNTLLNNSIQSAFAKKDCISDFVRSHAQSMSESVLKKHIDLYVNEFSLDLGPVGRSAIRFLLNKGAASGCFEAVSDSIFTEAL